MTEYEIHLIDGSRKTIEAYSYDGHGSTILSFYILNEFGHRKIRYRVPVQNILYIETNPDKGKQEQPEQMSRHGAQLLIDYGDHKSSCKHWGSKTDWTCDCLYPKLLEQAQSILEQSDG